MNKSIPIGVDNFAELINLKRNYQFVDKTLFIKDILDDGSEVTLITRPRCWGKTLNLSMLEYFLAPEVLGESTQGLFDDLAIGAIDQGRYLAFQGQSPVIFISFKDVKETQFDLAIRNIRSLLGATFAQHKRSVSNTGVLNADDEWLLDQHLKGEIDQPTLGYGLLTLSEVLYRGFQNKKVYILIDEYDTPLNYAYQYGYLEEMTRFMQNLLSAALKGNPYLEKGVMTGVLYISKDSMLSGLNNVDVHSVMRATYATHFGFSDEEVRKLFFESGLEHEMDLVREYYNGYRIGSHACYNPWSIMQCLNNGGRLDAYWVNTADDRLLRDALWQSSAHVKIQLQHLISASEDCVQNSVQQTIDTNLSDTIRFEDMMQDETVLWGLLLSTGYLTMVDKDTKHLSIKPRCTLAIPNQEVRSFYIHILQSWLP